MGTTTDRRDGEPLLRILDNPLLIAQGRLRLRRGQALPSFLVIGILALCVVVFAGLGSERSTTSWQVVSGIYLAIAAIALYFRGTLQVANTLMTERDSGLLDFHRATPTTPWTDAVGYLVGCASREYGMFTVLLPFLAGALIMVGASPLEVVQGLAAIISSALLFHSYALIVGLKAGGRRGVQGGLIAPLFVLFGISEPLRKVGITTLSYLTPVPILRPMVMGETQHSVALFGIPLPSFAWFALVQGSLLAFLLWGAARKLRSEELTVFSRVGALGFFSVCMTLLVGGSWDVIRQSVASPGTAASMMGPAGSEMLAAVVAVYLVAAGILGAVLSVSICPSHLTHFRSLVRSQRSGALRWTDDGAAPWGVVAGLSALALAGFAAVLMATRDGWDNSTLMAPQTLMALGWLPLFMALAASTAHYVNLGHRSASRGWAMLIVVGIVVLPWLAAATVDQGGNQSSLSKMLACLSPLFGLGVALGQVVKVWAGDATNAELTPYLYVSTAATAAVTALLAILATRRSAELLLRARGPQRSAERAG